MHFLHVVQLYHPVASGAARYFAEVGERLAAEGHRVTVLATEAHDLEFFWDARKRRVASPEETHNGVRIVRLPVRRMPGPPIAYPILRRLMAEISRVPGTAPLLRRMATLTPRLPDLPQALAAERFDLIHATNITLDFAVVPAFAFARRRRIPFICTPFVHLGPPGDDSLLRYYSMRHQVGLLARSDRVITMTRLEADALAARGVPRAILRPIGVGVTPAEVLGGDGARFRAEQQIHGQLVLYVGALAYDKGAIPAIQAMQRLWGAGSDATLALIGAPLEQFTRFYGALPAETKARIRLLPYAPEPVKRDALAAADVFAMPSRTDSFGIAYLEAWCYGVPVVGARAGGVPDVIADGYDGLLAPFADIPATAAAIERLLRDRELATRLGAAGRAKVLRDFTWDRIYAQVRAVYHELLPQSQ
ncbi:glycosyltransferase family 4 protein [Kouleothrix sp.]|uniref:glycosyltransferase family 4 protein n=1 Tax=Kouleothrix sp. TaxID=2779161 RepID=UPI003918EC9D